MRVTAASCSISTRDPASTRLVNASRAGRASPIVTLTQTTTIHQYCQMGQDPWRPSADPEIFSDDTEYEVERIASEEIDLSGRRW